MKESFIFSLILLTVGCTTTLPYRTESDNECIYVNEGDCSKQSITLGGKKGQEYLLSFYEYDEQGMLHYPDVPRKIINKYKSIADTNDVLLITFFHGWHHNAKGKKEDNDIVQFREVLSKAAQRHQDKKVLGLYIGWRGRSLFGWLDYLTFWGRKRTAHDVGELGGVTEALLELESMLKETKNTKSRMVTIGHSFGGAALYSTIGHVLIERYATSRKLSSANIVDGFGDMVILLNPAFEASRYTSLFELAQRGCTKFSERQPPRLISLSSKADLANGYAFQAGQFFNAIFEEHRNTIATHCTNDKEVDYQLRQFRADINAIGHYRPFISHDLTALPNSRSYSAQSTGDELSRLWRESFGEGEVRFNKAVLKWRNITQPFNPYMNVYTDKYVMANHNDIWTDEVLDFLDEMITVSTF